MWRYRTYVLLIICSSRYQVWTFVTLNSQTFQSEYQSDTISMFLVMMACFLVQYDCQVLVGLGWWPPVGPQTVPLNRHLGLDAPRLFPLWDHLPCCLRWALHSENPGVPCRISAPRGGFCYDRKGRLATGTWRWWGRRLQESHHIKPGVKKFTSLWIHMCKLTRMYYITDAFHMKSDADKQVVDYSWSVAKGVDDLLKASVFLWLWNI